MIVRIEIEERWCININRAYLNQRLKLAQVVGCESFEPTRNPSE